MSQFGPVECSHHGLRRAAFVCCHVVAGEHLGWVEAVEPGEDRNRERCAWCYACEAVRQERGGWDDVSEAHAQVTLLCELCFETARERNLPSTPPSAV